MTDDFSDLPDAYEKDPAKRHPRLRESVHFEIGALPHTDHPVPGRPGAIGEGFGVPMVNGDRLSLDTLFQYRTHAGQLAGFPEVDEDKFASAIRYAQSTFPHHDAPPVVVPPTLHRGRARRVRDGVESFEDWCVLPPVTSFGRFTANRAATDSPEPYSSVLLIWFQDKWGLPEEPRTLRLIAELDWERYAHNWCW